MNAEIPKCVSNSFYKETVKILENGFEDYGNFYVCDYKI